LPQANLAQAVAPQFEHFLRPREFHLIRI